MRGRLRAPCSLFGRGSLLGCYRFLCFRLWSLAVLLRRAARLTGRLLLPPPSPPARRVRLGRRQIVGERVRNLGDRAELLAGGLERGVRARRVALGRGQKCAGDADRQVLRRLAELRGVLLVPLAARVGKGAEKSFRLGELRRRLPVEHLPDGAGEAPRPARENLVGRVGLAL